MAEIIPFKGIRYNQDKIRNLAEVTTPPYDVISPEAQDYYYSRNPYNFIRIELGKELPGDNEKENKYTRAGKYLNQWLEEKILVHEDKPSLYLYDQEFTLKNGERKTRRGLMCLVRLYDFSEKVVLPHEETLSKAKADRFNLMTATSSNTSQIFSLYNDPDHKVTSVLNRYAMTNKPDIDFTDDDGITERIWTISDDATIKSICSEFEGKQLFIADGHHRYETALNYRNARKAENPNHTGNEPYNYVLMVLVEMDDPGLVVFPTHRLVRDVRSFDGDKLVELVKQDFNVEKIQLPEGHNARQAALVLEKELEARSEGTALGYYTGKDFAFILTFTNKQAMKSLIPDRSEAYRQLDVSVLHTMILENHLGIDSVNMANQVNLTYTRDTVEALEKVHSGEFQCAFFLNPTKISQIKDVSLANDKMPQKSTYFYPKLLTGLVINKMD